MKQTPYCMKCSASRLSASSVDKGRARWQEREERGEREVEGSGYSFEKVKHKNVTFWQEISFEPCEILSAVTQCQKFQYYFDWEHFHNRRLVLLLNFKIV